CSPTRAQRPDETTTASTPEEETPRTPPPRRAQRSKSSAELSSALTHTVDGLRAAINGAVQIGGEQRVLNLRRRAPFLRRLRSERRCGRRSRPLRRAGPTLRPRSERSDRIAARST